MKRIGIGLTVLGIMLITGAIGLLMQNREEERVAAQSVQAVMVQIESAQISVPEEEMPEEMPEEIQPVEESEPEEEHTQSISSKRKPRKALLEKADNRK